MDYLMLLKLGRIPEKEEEYFKFARAITWSEENEQEKLNYAVKSGVIEAMGLIFGK